jgi:hypothetical protein
LGKTSFSVGNTNLAGLRIRVQNKTGVQKEFPAMITILKPRLDSVIIFFFYQLFYKLQRLGAVECAAAVIRQCKKICTLFKFNILLAVTQLEEFIH